ncbi:hypothetical protein [uncultured Gimesia sp.]|uniref:hypothetical protein n=1 Tax=uncultured Gimesia sp. TaxID=1678688 RepID=UPI0030D86A9E
MSREIPQRYSEYRGLNIPKSKETEWTREEILSALDRLQSGETPRKELWAIHSAVTTLVLDGRFHDQLEPLLDASSSIEGVMRSQRDHLIVAETIVGRQDIQYRPGLIFRAYDSSREDLAARYAGLADTLVEKPFIAPVDEDRRQRLILALEKTRIACNIAKRIV